MVNLHPEINGTLAGQNIMYFFQYANQVTNHLFVLFVLVAFYLVVLLSSIVMQIRFTSRVRFEVSFLAASFASVGFTTIMAQVDGLVSPVYFFIFIGLSIVSFLWVALATNE